MATLNADLYQRNWRKRYFDALHAIVPDIYIHQENWRTFSPQIIDDFPAVWNYGKLSVKFLVNSVKVIDTLGLLSFFLSFTQITVKVPLKNFSTQCKI